MGIDAVVKERHKSASGSSLDKSNQTEAPPTTKSLQPIVRGLLSMEFEKSVQDKLENTCRLSLAGDHMRAQQAYIDLTIGSAKWALGGFAYTNDNARSASLGANSRMREIEATVSLLDNDIMKAALQKFKRLLSYMETR